MDGAGWRRSRYHHSWSAGEGSGVELPSVIAAVRRSRSPTAKSSEVAGHDGVG
jgi:hypothetical protein